MNPITRRNLLAGGAAAVVHAASASRPNVLLIFTDQQTHSSMSCAGNPWLKTPAMDSLAATGTRFSECYSTYPLCSPARSSMFTGRMPHETGVRVNSLPVKAGIPTLGEIFSSAGYDTAYAGKWHLPDSKRMTGFECLIGASPMGAEMDAPAAAACVDWLRRRKSGKPFLMVASLMNPHDICEWIRQHPGRREHANPDVYPPAPGNMAADPAEPEYMHWHRTEGKGLVSQAVGIAAEWRAVEFREYLHAYYRLVEQVDAQVGRVLEALRAAGLADNTLVAFTSDHGEGMGGHRLVQKSTFYEESVHVPMIFSGPMCGKPGRVDRTSLVSLLDLLPTFCDYAGIPVPRDVRGLSVRAALEGKRLDREFVVSELRQHDATREGRMLRTSRYKYIVFSTGARPEQLFDLELDPGEILNLSSSPGHREVLERHRKLLANWVRGTNDDFRPAIPNRA